ncbi:asparagine synthase-related protein [Brevibacillus brevis]|nr:asparagine synthase-related protein [Brevibacillus brevis]
MKWFACSINFNGEPTRITENQFVSLIHKKTSSIIRSHSQKIEQASFFIADSINTRPPEIYAQGDLVLIGDIRIDNRNELLMKYSLINEGEIRSDEILVLTLFNYYGEQFVVDILGEFSFIIWNSKRKCIYAARDQMGIKSLYWNQKGHNVWISSDIMFLRNTFSLDDLDMEYLKNFYITGICDSELTPYKDVKRVPSAHSISIDGNSTKRTHYWKILDNNKKIIYRDLSEYEEHFIDLLKKSVQYRLSLNTINSVMMSGGLDSTSVFAIAKQLGYSALPICGVFDELRGCDERRYINPILKKYNANAEFVLCDDNGTLSNFPNDYIWTEEPHVNALNFSLTSSLINRASISGSKNMLTGFAGDHVLGGSPAIIADLLKEYKWKQILQHAIPYARDTRGSVPGVICKFGILPQFKKGIYKSFISHSKSSEIKKAEQECSFTQMALLKQLSGITARLFSDREIGPLFGVDCKHPFLDRRLVEYLFNIPGHLCWSAGNTKVLLRKAMQNYLPEEVTLRENKTEHGALTHSGLRTAWRSLYPVISKGRVVTLGFITLDDWIKTINVWRQGHMIREDLWTLIVLELWLYKLELEIGKSIAS